MSSPVYHRLNKVRLHQAQQCLLYMLYLYPLADEGYMYAIMFICVEAGIVPSSPFTLYTIMKWSLFSVDF